MGIDLTAPATSRFADSLREDIKSDLKDRVMSDPKLMDQAREALAEQVDRGNIAGPVQPPAISAPPMDAEKAEKEDDDGIFKFFTDPLRIFRGDF